MVVVVNAREPDPTPLGPLALGACALGADLVGGHGVETVGEIIN